MGIVQLTAILFGFWILLGGSFDLAGLAIGLVLSFVVALITIRLLWTQDDAPVLSVQQGIRFALYVPWLIKEIIWASVDVAEKVLDPRLPIDPVMVEHTSVFEQPVADVLFANSITLTPGTLTVDVEDSVFHVHCLDHDFADALATRELDHKVLHVFKGA